MKVVYEPGEIERIEEIYQKFGSGLLFNDDPERIYGITFNVTNPALATWIFSGLLHKNLEDFNLGIEVKSIEFDPITLNRTELRNKLVRAIDEVI